MISQAPDMQTIIGRLERLEKQNRRLKTGLLTFMLLIGLVVITAGAIPTPRAVEAHAFAVKDDNGRVRARLHVDAAGVALELFDSSGVSRAALMLGPSSESPAVVLTDHDMKARVILGLDSGEPSIELEDVSGLKSVLKASSLETIGKDGKVLWRAP